MGRFEEVSNDTLVPKVLTCKADVSETVPRFVLCLAPVSELVHRVNTIPNGLQVLIKQLLYPMGNIMSFF